MVKVVVVNLPLTKFPQGLTAGCPLPIWGMAQAACIIEKRKVIERKGSPGSPKGEVPSSPFSRGEGGEPCLPRFT